MTPRTFQSEFTRACIYGHCQVPVDENELLEHLLGVRTWHYTLYTTNRCNGRLYFRRCRLPKKNAIYKTGANYLSTFLGGYQVQQDTWTSSTGIYILLYIRMHLLPRSTRYYSTALIWRIQHIRCTRYQVPRGILEYLLHSLLSYCRYFQVWKILLDCPGVRIAPYNNICFL